MKYPLVSPLHFLLKIFGTLGSKDCHSGEQSLLSKQGHMQGGAGVQLPNYLIPRVFFFFGKEEKDEWKETEFMISYPDFEPSPL